MPNTCAVCAKIFYSYQNKIECCFCNRWCHHNNRLNCSNLSENEFQAHVDDPYKYFECDTCVSRRISKENRSIFQRLPFVQEFEASFDVFKPFRRNDVRSLSPDDLQTFISQSNSINVSSILDVDDQNDSPSTSLNSKYYQVNEFNALDFDTNSKFSLFHTNIASLNLHIDDLKSVLSRIKLPFNVIAISEHKIHKDMVPSNNIDIPGYDFVFQPTLSTHGGTGFYIKNNLDFEKRDDLCISSGTD